MDTDSIIGFPIPVTRTVLKSGLTVITAATNTAFALAKVVIASGGLRDGDHPGAAHFLEHAVFEGPSRAGMHPRLSRFVRRGLQGNAMTSFERTEYFVTGLATDVLEAVPDLLGIVLSPDITEDAVDKEREVVRQEVRDRETGNEYGAWRMARTHGHVARFQVPLGGTVEGLGGIGATELRAFHGGEYVPGRMALVVAGGITHEAVLQALAGIDLRDGDPIAPERPGFDPAIVTAEYRDNRRASGIQMYVPVAPSKRDRIVVNLALELLTHPRVGTLFRELRAEKRIAYQVGVEKTERVFRELDLYVQTQPGNFQVAEDSMRRWLRWLGEGAYSEDAWETLLAESRLKALASSENIQRGASHQIGNMLAHGWLRDSWKPGLELEVYGSLTPADVAAVAREHLNPDRFGKITVRATEA